MLKYRKLGNSSLHISEISLGCMSLPLNISEAQGIIEHALDAGINYFDTADLYDKGKNEEMIGQILKPYREKIILATKVGNRFTEGQESWTWDPSRAHILKSVKDSLRRLQIDKIDVYQLHGGTVEDNLDEVIDTFEELKKNGYIREFGISSIRPNVFMPFSKSSAISNMMQYNLLDRSAEEYFDALHANGMSVVTRGSLAKGLLTNDWANKLKPYMNYSEEELKNLLPQLSNAANLHALALAFNLQHEVIASTVIGASSKAQLKQSIEAYEDMPTDFEQEIMALLKSDRYQQHR